MQFIETNLGFSTADGEHVELTYQEGNLRLLFIDWQERSITYTFRDVLGFKWDGGDTDSSDIRDDMTYIVLDSPWLQCQAQLEAECADDYAHYRLGFNACGVLDVLARKAQDAQLDDLRGPRTHV
jgi:hypothetical protein